MKRTADIQVEKDFEFAGEIVKSYVDSKTGERHIIGAASGVEEDRDGERVSKNCIAKMAAKAQSGDVRLTCTHQEDWWSTIGKAVKGWVDEETGQFMIDTTLAPEGSDPIADKAWKRANEGGIGFSVGGKLRSAFYELTDLCKKRKVLDHIDLKHVCLTDKPAYQHSFAQAVAKTFDGPEPEDGDFSEVEKDLTTGSWVSGGGRNTGDDSKGSGERNAGTRSSKSKQPDVQEEESQENEHDDNDDPLEAGRHLACPNCGHEFAAPLPPDMTPSEREKDDSKPDEKDEKDDEPTKGDESKKTMEDTIMDLTKTVRDLEALVVKHITPDSTRESASAAASTVEGDSPVEKTAEISTEPGGDAVPTETAPDVLKMVAASHAEHEERFDRIEKSMGEALGLIGENLKQMREQLSSTPLGRKSVARILPPPDGHEDVGKTTGERLAEAQTPAEALKIMNAEAYGIR